jgi:hypothetical protein
MGSYPDIIVTGTESPRILLAVETRLDSARYDQAARELQNYLVSMSCPVGLVATPQEVGIYRNHFTGPGPDAVEEVCRLRDVRVFPGVDQLPIAERGAAFERLVQIWLEELAQGRLLNALPPDFRNAVELHILPALENGIVRASGPRLGTRR